MHIPHLSQPCVRRLAQTPEAGSIIYFVFLMLYVPQCMYVGECTPHSTEFCVICITIPKWITRVWGVQSANLWYPLITPLFKGFNPVPPYHTTTDRLCIPESHPGVRDSMCICMQKFYDSAHVMHFQYILPQDKKFNNRYIIQDLIICTSIQWILK